MRRRERIFLACLAVSLLVAVAAIMLVGGEDSRQVGHERAQTQGVRAACTDRAEGDYAGANDPEATRIGPVTWPAIAANLRGLLAGKLGPPPGTDYPYHYYPVKALAFVKAGHTVTISVPRSQRAYVRLAYGHDNMPLNGVWQVTLSACRQSRSRAARARECKWPPRTACRRRHTQFAGAFHIDFGRAPEQGLCSELIVRERRRRPMRALLFDPPPGRC